VIHAVGHFFVSLEALDEKNPPVPVKRPCHPNSDWNRNEEIKGIGCYGFVHFFILVESFSA
jgi:hypothetical protein